MIYNKRSLFALLLVFTLSSAVFADFDAASFVNQFNNMNGGQGLKFTSSVSSNERQINFASGTATPDLSAYVLDNISGTAGAAGNHFRTFCVEPTGSTSGTNYGKLSYNGSTSSVVSTSSAYNGKTVNLGTAFLYSHFTAGTLIDYQYVGSRSTSASALQTALQATMGITTVSNWGSNTFLDQLLSINSNQAYWMRAYNPSQYYAEVGDYAVFALNVTNSTNGNMQDYLYATKVYNGGGEVPEPATLLLWSLGGLALVGAKARRRKSEK